MAGKSKKDNNVNTGITLEDSGLDPHFIRQIEEWTAFYRLFPFMYVKHAMGITLKLFQKILLYCMDNWMFFCFMASRGLGKSWLTAVYIVTRCILYPNTKIVIASGQLSQACEVLEYVDKLRLGSDAIDKEIRFLSTNKANAKCDFWNGSSIRIVASTEGSRGKRANLLIVDEYRMVPKDILDLVLRKFKSDPRYCGWHDKEPYATLIKKGKIKREVNKEIYLSSAYYRHHWSYKHFMSFFALMTLGKENDGSGLKKRTHFACCLPYQLAIESGIKDIESLQAEYDEGIDETTWAMEYECEWIGQNDETSWFKYDSLNSARKLTNVLIPPELADKLDMNDKYFREQTKRPDEIRILFADIARKVSNTSENDNTSLGVLSLTKTINRRNNKDMYLRDLRYMETFEGKSTPEQALRIRQLYNFFDCDYIVIDAQNLGTGIIDLLELPIVDPETKEEYAPLNTINHDEMKLGRVPYPTAKKAIYGFLGNYDLNSDIAYATRDSLNQRKVRLPIDEMDATKYLVNIKGFDKFTPEIKGQLRAVYVQTSALINEMVSLDYKIEDGRNKVKLTEPRSGRKDRYSSFSYANYYADTLEAEMIRKSEGYGSIDSYIDYFEF